MSAFAFLSIPLASFGMVDAAAIDLVLPPNGSPFPLKAVLLVLGATCLLTWAIYQVWIYPFFLSPLRHLPTPKGGYPVVGHALARVKRPIGQEQLNWITEVPNDGLILIRGFLNSETLCLTSPQALAEVLVTKNYDFGKPPGAAEFLRRILGNGLVVVEGDVHKFQRKHIQPSFSFRHVKELYPLFWSKSVEVVEKITAGFPLGDQTRSGVSDISFWAPKVTLDIIGIAGLGRDFHTIINNDDELAQTYDDITSPSFKTSVIFGFSVLGMKWVLRFLPWDIEQNLRTNTDKIRVLCRQFIVDKKRMIKVDSSSEESADLLSKLMKSNDFSDEELVDQLLTFLMAGHETTSSTLEWTLYLLARHPDIQQQLRDEIRANVPYASSADGSFDLAGVLESMPLLNAVCNESLRFYPTVPQSMRVATRPTSVLGYPVPKGMLIVLSPFGINRSPQLWGPDAHVFNPQRWIDAETGKPNNSGGATSNYSFLTFLHGPRSCIGQGFSKAELRTLLAAFVGAFEMELEDPDYRPTRAGVVTTKPSGGLPLKLKVVGTWSKPV